MWDTYLSFLISSSLEHFSIEGSTGITIKKGFIIKETIQYAYKIGIDVDFVLKRDLGKYLLE